MTIVGTAETMRMARGGSGPRRHHSVPPRPHHREYEYMCGHMLIYREGGGHSIRQAPLSRGESAALWELGTWGVRTQWWGGTSPAADGVLAVPHRAEWQSECLLRRGPAPPWRRCRVGRWREGRRRRPPRGVAPRRRPLPTAALRGAVAVVLRRPLPDCGCRVPPARARARAGAAARRDDVRVGVLDGRRDARRCPHRAPRRAWAAG